MADLSPSTSSRTPNLAVSSAAARRLEVADQDWATRLLTQAAAGHPALGYVCDGPAAEQQQQWLLAQLLALALHHGGAYANAAGTALALWLGPRQAAAAWDLRLVLLTATWYLGWASQQHLRQLLRTAAWLRHQSLAEPHHLLLTVAVHPDVQGRGGAAVCWLPRWPYASPTCCPANSARKCPASCHSTSGRALS